MINNSIQLTKEVFFGDAPENWNENLLNSVHSTLFQSFNWAETYQNAYNSIPVYVVIKENKKVVGQLQAIIHNNYYWNKGGKFSNFLNRIFKIGNLLSWRYGPIIHDLKNYEKILSEILICIDEISEQKNIIMIRGSSPPTISNSKNIFSKFSYTVKPWSTYIIDLNQDLNEYYTKLNKNIRYDIRIAEKNNLTFETSFDPKLFKQYSELKIRKEKVTKIQQKYVDSHSKNLLKKGKEIIFLAKHNDEIVSGISGIIFNKHLIQHTVANSSKKNLQGGSFVTWNAIKWAQNNDISYFNMGGVNPEPENSKEKNIDFFKMKWLGKEYPYYTYFKIVNPMRYKFSKLLITSKIHGKNK